MADCGASGTALDQAARSLIGDITNAAHARKQIGSFLGHATIGGAPAQEALPIPIARPESIILPNEGDEEVLMAAAPVKSSQCLQQHPVKSIHAVAAAPPRTEVALMPHYMRKNHQQQIAAAVQQQQRMMMQMHHYDQMVVQHQHADRMKAAQEAAIYQTAAQVMDKVVEGENSDAELVDYREGRNMRGATVEKLSVALAERLDDENAQIEEGNVRGASMEALAAAWAEAQDEYYGPIPFEEGPGDLSGNENNNLNGLKTTYEFVNDVVNGTVEVPLDANFMEEGMRHFENGDLKVAIRCFEMELQANNPDNSTAWRMLGRCHAENDQDREAIVCLEKAVDRDPYCTKSMSALGVSYVNELRHAEALAVLKNWITMNAKYAGLEISQEVDLYGDGGQKTDGNGAAFQELQSLLLQALEFDGSGHDSADVWEALGVAANVTGDYETAVEAFRKAIDSRPNDYQLWNKLGATLANSSCSSQALPAYHKAIELKPKYARAWLNLAISYSNLRDFDEAARCYLQTLSLNPGAVHCWSYLRVALSCSERWDLLPFAASQNLGALREHYDFQLPLQEEN